MKTLVCAAAMIAALAAALARLESAQHVLERCLVGGLEAEGAHDVAPAGGVGIVADIGEKLVLRREAGLTFVLLQRMDSFKIVLNI